MKKRQPMQVIEVSLSSFASRSFISAASPSPSIYIRNLDNSQQTLLFSPYILDRISVLPWLPALPVPFLAPPALLSLQLLPVGVYIRILDKFRQTRLSDDHIPDSVSMPPRTPLSNPLLTNIKSFWLNLPPSFKQKRQRFKV